MLSDFRTAYILNRPEMDKMSYYIRMRLLLNSICCNLIYT